MRIKGRLLELRKEKRITQSKMADILHLDQTAYSNYELGKRKVPYTVLISLSKYYDVSIDYLVGLTNDKKRYSEIK